MSYFDEQAFHGPQFQFTSLTQLNRRAIVLLSADANLPGYAPVTVNEFQLSALGVTADLLGQWEYPNPPPVGDPALSLVSWRHIAATGRDIYVRVTNRGYLFPLGHEAVIVTVVERVVVTDPEDHSYSEAYLQVQTYIRVLQQEKSYPAPGQPFGTNDWPFATVEILTTVSPLLDEPNSASDPSYNPPVGPVTNDGTAYPQVFLPTSAGSPVQWDLVATDLAGNQLHLQVPLCFFGSENGGTSISEFDATHVTSYINAYNELAGGLRSASGHAFPLQMSPEAGGPPGGTTHPVVNLALGAATTTLDPNVPISTGLPYPPAMGQDSLGANHQPAFFPVLAEVQVRLPAADALSRGTFSDSSNDGVVLQYYPGYVVDGFPANSVPASNRGGIYAQFKDAVTVGSTAPLLQFPADAVGGLGCPNGHMLGMSAIAGPVSGDATSVANATTSLANYASSGALAPADYFKQLAGQAQTALSQFLGGLPLGGILKSFGVDLPGAAPNITSNLDQSTGVLTVTYTLTAELTAFPTSGPATNIFVPDPGGNLNLQATATVAPDGTTTYNVSGSIDPFTLNLFGDSGAQYVVQVPFNNMSFVSQNGQKPQVQVAIGGNGGNSVTFEGCLEFVNALQSFLSDLGGSGLSISVTGSELDASFSLSLPTVAVGVFSLSGIALSAGLTIPFLGGPTVAQFGFASADNPFTLTVCMFGGGGFFALGLGFGGIQQIQAQFQFEGSFELDIVVASGGITLAAGIYYSYTAPNDTEISGFVRLTGELSVLGLISISAELDLTLTYQSPGSVEGTASLTVTIHLVFFSISPSITVHKQFSGGGGDPSGGQLIEMTADGPAGDRRAALPSHHAPPPVNAILFKDIVPDQTTWDAYVGAFAA